MTLTTSARDNDIIIDAPAATRKRKRMAPQRWVLVPTVLALADLRRRLLLLLSLACSANNMLILLDVCQRGV